MFNTYLHHGTCSTDPIGKIFVIILFAFNSSYVILIEWTFYYFVMCKCISTTVCVKSIVQFTFFFVMRFDCIILLYNNVQSIKK